MKRKIPSHCPGKRKAYIVDVNGELLGMVFKCGEIYDKIMLDVKNWDIEDQYNIDADFYETATDEEWDKFLED